MSDSWSGSQRHRRRARSGARRSPPSVRLVSRRGSGPEDPNITRVAADAKNADASANSPREHSPSSNCVNPVSRGRPTGHRSPTRCWRARRDPEPSWSPQQPVRLRASTGRYARLSPPRRLREGPGSSQDVARREASARRGTAARVRGARLGLHRTESESAKGECCSEGPPRARAARSWVARTCPIAGLTRRRRRDPDRVRPEHPLAWGRVWHVPRISGAHAASRSSTTRDSPHARTRGDALGPTSSRHDRVVPRKVSGSRRGKVDVFLKSIISDSRGRSIFATTLALATLCIALTGTGGAQASGTRRAPARWRAAFHHVFRRRHGEPRLRHRTANPRSRPPRELVGAGQPATTEHRTESAQLPRLTGGSTFGSRATGVTCYVDGCEPLQANSRAPTSASTRTSRESPARATWRLGATTTPASTIPSATTTTFALRRDSARTCVPTAS